MHKIMLTAAAAALIGTVSAIESANIVGYQIGAITNGAQAIGGTFLPISAAGTMKDIIVTGYEKASGNYNEVSCAKLNKYGVQIKDMYWIDYDDGAGTTAYGWYGDQEGQDDMNDEPLAAGQGLWTQCDTSETGNELSIQHSGQVPNTLTVVALTNGAQLVACCCPRDATMAEIIVSGYEKSVGNYNEVSCAKLNKYGVQIKDMYWIDYDDGAGTTAYGWYGDQEGTDDMNDEPVTPGQGLWTQCDTSESGNVLFINFPKGIKD